MLPPFMHYYLHVPFCRSKCGYCAFYSIPGAADEVIDAYLTRLEATFDPAEPAESCYLGGGTPTCLNAAQLERLLRLLRSRLEFASGAEISAEANPETLDADKTALLRSFLTRLSLGVQSFAPETRSRIGRRCSQSALERALELVRAAGFPHWNIDLIFALPGQSDAELLSGVERAVALGVDHLSLYALTAEETAALQLPEDDDRAARLLPELAEFLAARGLARYEVSNYARPGGECRHNAGVWRGERLRGFGPAAASFDGVDRRTEPASLADWLHGVAPTIDHLTPEARRREIFAVNLRTVAGWTPELWARLPGAEPWAELLERTRRTAKQFPAAWFVINAERIALTGDGLLFWNSVAAEVL